VTVSVDMSEVQRWGGLLASEAQAIYDRVVPAVEDQQAQVEARAKAEAPRRTGVLAGSVRRTGKGLIRRVKAGSARAYYAHFHEFGTKKMSANPFLLTQADASTHSEFEGRVQRAVDNGPVYR
jgi:HK97 gp10 family phage protein